MMNIYTVKINIGDDLTLFIDGVLSDLGIKEYGEIMEYIIKEEDFLRITTKGDVTIISTERLRNSIIYIRNKSG